MSAEEFNIGSDAHDLFTQPSGGDPSAAPRRRPAHSSSSLVRENLLLAALFGAGIIVVYILRLRGGPAVASAEQLANELQVETAVAALSAQPAASAVSKSKSVMEGLEAKPRQIPLERVRGNPFVYHSPAPAVPATAPAAGSETKTPAQPVDQGMPAAMNALKQMNLQSILSGAGGRPMALISNNLLSEGQMISGWTVTKINAREVVLTYKDKQETLRIE